MGTWNTKPFGNDTALDWLWDLEKATNGSVLESAFRVVLRSNDAPDADDCETAIAAAAVVLASRRDPIGKLPEEAKHWVAERGLAASNSLLSQSVQALERIREHSDLRELWAESPSFAKWQKEIESLLTELRNVQKRPLPARKPKPPGTRLSLPKLIEKITPDEESPLREKLRKKLEAIADVNAPLDDFNTPLDHVADPKSEMATILREHGGRFGKEI